MLAALHPFRQCSNLRRSAAAPDFKGTWICAKARRQEAGDGASDCCRCSSLKFRLYTLHDGSENWTNQDGAELWWWGLTCLIPMDQKDDMVRPTAPASGLERDKSKALLKSNAQTIFQDLTKLRAVPEGPSRWVWELLQNACDAVDRTRGVNRVRIEFGGGKMRFMHNGAAFTGEEVTHLIYHGSTKQEDEGKKGKFGSGFLTVHLISPKVLVRGVLIEEEVREGFEFVLDRGGENANEIEKRMEEAWAQLLRGRWPGVESGEYSTIYEFELGGKAEAVVRRGLENLEAGLPYVLAFVGEIEEVTVAAEGETTSWGRNAQDSAHGMLVTDVARTTAGKKDPTMFKVACAGDPEDGVGVAALFEKNGDTWKCAVREEAPKLFYPLPLVGTHDLGIPFSVSSVGLEPMPERNGIYAGSLDDAPTRSNWMLLALVPGLYSKLLQGCMEKGWGGLEELARFSGAFSGSWLDRGRFRADVLVPCIEHLRGHSGPQIVQNRAAKPLRISEALLPVGESEGNVYELAKRVLSVRERLPSAETHGKWASIFDGWAAIIGSRVDELKQSLTLEGLGDEVKEAVSLEGLSKLLAPKEKSPPLDWLNEMFAAVSKEKLPGFIKVRALVPNQLDFLKKEGELWLDGGIDEDLKNICAKLGDHVRGELLHSEVHACVGQLFQAVKAMLKKIIVASEAKGKILKQLYNAGVSISSIFPGLDGVSSALKYRYSKEFIEETKKKASGPITTEKKGKSTVTLHLPPSIPSVYALPFSQELPSAPLAPVSGNLDPLPPVEVMQPSRSEGIFSRVKRFFGL
jgi:hypothetical protein